METNNNPVLENEISQEKQEINATEISKPEEPAVQAASAAEPFSPQPVKKKSFFKSKKFLIVAGVILAVILISSISNALKKSDEAKAADALIEQIGIVSLETGDAKIVAAEKAVDALISEHREELDNLDKLEAARETYDQLVLDSKVKAVEDAINAIGAITLESAEAIEKAREAYDNSDEDVKNVVSNYATLEKAEAEISSLRVNQVIALIDKIGTVTLNSGDAIDTADEVYKKLNDSDKEKVTNYGKLTAAKTTLKELKAADRQKRIKAALAGFNSKHDKVTGNTFYKSKNYPKYIDTRSYVLPYIGENDGHFWVRLKFNYTGDDWIFWEELTFLIDGERYYKTVGYSNVERDNDSGDVWEYYDYNPSSTDMEMLEKIANSKETIVRFEGDRYRYDLTVSAEDKAAIKQVVAAYKIMEEE